MWISGKTESTFSHAHEQWGFDLFCVEKKVKIQRLSTSYTQIVDKVMDGGQLCCQDVDAFLPARYCGSDEK